MSFPLTHSPIPFLPRVCIDTSECGELSSGVHLGEYHLTHQWSALTQSDHYTVSVNVHNDGNLLEIVGMCCKCSVLCCVLLCCNEEVLG